MIDTCNVCGKEFERTGKQKVCEPCAKEKKIIARIREKRGLPPKTKTCSFCGKEIMGTKHFLAIYNRTNSHPVHIREKKTLCQRCTDMLLRHLWREE